MSEEGSESYNKAKQRWGKGEELTDQEFACLLFRSCGVSNLVGALGYAHAEECGFCLGTKQVDPSSYRGRG